MNIYIYQYKFSMALYEISSYNINIMLDVVIQEIFTLGELGKPVKINVEQLSPEDKRKYEEGMEKNQMNEFVSDLISVHRSLDPDMIDPV